MVTAQARADARRLGSAPVDIHVRLVRHYNPPWFHIEAPLAEVIGMRANTRGAVLRAVWGLVQAHSTPDPDDPATGARHLYDLLQAHSLLKPADPSSGVVRLGG